MDEEKKTKNTTLSKVITTDEQFFTPGYYSFTGKGRIENWCGSFAAHDRWAKSELRQWMKKKGIDLR